MRHVKMLGLCLVAALALCAYVVSSAAALPEWGKCEAKTGGKYEDSNCTVKAKGKTGKHEYEWVKGANLKAVKFTGHNVGSGGVLTATLRECAYGPGEAAPPGGGPKGVRVSRKACKEKIEKEPRNEETKTPGWVEVTPETDPTLSHVECASETSSGETVGKDSIDNVSVTFKGCKLFGFTPCKTTGKEAGEIVTNTLKGSLGYINKANKEVGVVLEPAQKHAPFAEFTCGSLLSIVVGVGNKKEGAYFEPESKGGDDQIISPITPVNQMTTEYTQVYTIEKEGIVHENIPNKFEGKPRSALESYQFSPTTHEVNGTFAWTSAGEEITNVNTPEEAGEIKA